MQSLLMTISGFEKDEVRQQEKQAEIEKLKSVDLLIVDEAWNTSAVTLYKSGYQLPFLTQFLKERFEVARKGIVFISNVSPESIAKIFENPLQNLIARSVVRTTLKLEDNYMQTRTDFNPNSLFDEE